MSDKVLNRIKHQASSVLNKWTTGRNRKLGINRIEDELTRLSTTLIMENVMTADDQAANPLVEEANTIGSWGTPGTAGSGVGNPAGANANSAMYRPISLALARRVFPSLFAHKLVGVQPMAAPVGMAFAMRNYWMDADTTGTKLSNKEVGFYDIDKDTIEAATLGTCTVGTKTLSADEVLFYALKLDTDQTDDIKVVNTAGSESITANTQDLLDELYEQRVQYRITKLKGGTLKANTKFDTAAAEKLGINNGSDTYETDKNFREIGIKWDQKTIFAQERPLAASFSIQSMQDIKALHEIDLKAEVMNVLQYESTAELDRELLNELKKTAVDTVNKGGDILEVKLNEGGLSDNRQMTAILVNSILFAANTISKYTKRGKANFVVVSNKVATLLQAAVPFFTPIEAKVDAGIILSGSESTHVGKINGQIDVYLDQFAEVDYALVGYKGTGNVSDSGVIFAPYIMGLKQEAIAQENFQPRIGVFSRYAIVTGLIDAGAYYRALVFTGLDDAILGDSASATLTNW
jgi:hypothetical protein